MMGTESLEGLRSQGWVDQFTASGSRLEEAVENYQMLGFEVKTVPVRELDLEGCTVCFDADEDTTMMIFTRKSSG